MTEEMGKLFFKAIEHTRHKNRLYGHMGLQQDDGSFIFQDDDSRVGRVYVRVSTGKQTSEIEDSTEQLVQAINQGAPLVGDLPVWLERTPSGELKIVEVDWALALEMIGDRAPGLSIGPHSHRLGFGLEDFVEGRRFEPGLVTLSATGGMNVFVNPIHYNGGMWVGGDFDLSAYQPATANRKWWVVIYVDTTTGELSAETGDELPLSYAPMVEPEAAAIPVPAGSLVLAGVVVNDSQIVVDGNTTIIDMRWWGTASPYYQQIQINGTDYNARKTLNLLSDGSVGFAITDDAGNDVTELTITSAGGGSGSGSGGYITVQQIDNAITVNDVGTVRFTKIIDNMDGSVDVPAYNHTIGDNGTLPMDQRGILNFDDGVGTRMTLTDDAGNDETDVQVDLDIDSLTAEGAPDQDTDYVPVYVAGIPGIRKVLLSNLPGGGGTAGGSIWEPRAAPASPSASDSEFSASSGGVPTGFTETDFDTNTTVNESAAGLLLTQTTHAGESVAGIYKAIPDANYSIWTRVSQLSPTMSGAFRAGITLYEDATDPTGDILTWHIFAAAGANWGYQAARYAAYNSTATNVFSAAGGVFSSMDSLFLRLRFNGTTYTCELSKDGMSSITISTITAAALGYTPTHMGLSVNNVNTGFTLSGLFQFFRYAGSDVGIIPMNGARVNYFV